MLGWIGLQIRPHQIRLFQKTPRNTALTTITVTTTTKLYPPLHYTRLHNPTLHHDTNYSTANAIATTLRKAHQTSATTPLRFNYKYSCTTPFILYPAIVGEVTDQVTIATVVTIPRKMQLQPHFSLSFAWPSVVHNNQTPPSGFVHGNFCHCPSQPYE